MVESLLRVVNEAKKKLVPEQKETNAIRVLTKKFLETVNESILSNKILADVFVGGSYAKGTFLKSKNYDVDVFIRFDWTYETLSEHLEKIVVDVSKKLGMTYEKVHGSRDYFHLYPAGQREVYFEVIPVTRIKKPQEERNVTDLTYFHAPYVKKHIKGLENEVRITKQFFKAHRVYGAETYVRGFSGYCVELLIIQYRSFLKLIRALGKMDASLRTVIDTAKHYPKKNEVFIHLNEAKLQSPIILIDPTYKERNALAALSHETFEQLQTSIKQFLKKPNLSFFEINELDVSALKERAKRKDAEFVTLQLNTDKQQGDIAGTKLKKFHDFLITQLEPYFVINENHFTYFGEQRGNSYLLLKKKKEIIRIGPPLHMKKHVTEFKREHLETYEKNRHVHARINLTFTAEHFIHTWMVANKERLKQMHITEMVII